VSWFDDLFDLNVLQVVDGSVSPEEAVRIFVAFQSVADAQRGTATPIAYTVLHCTVHLNMIIGLFVQRTWNWMEDSLVVGQ
jgi:hypothetical protein